MHAGGADSSRGGDAAQGAKWAGYGECGAWGCQRDCSRCFRCIGRFGEGAYAKRADGMFRNHVNVTSS